jgi:hypothetical protein
MAWASVLTAVIALFGFLQKIAHLMHIPRGLYPERLKLL